MSLRYVAGDRTPWVGASLLDPPGAPELVLLAVTPARQLLIQRDGGALMLLELESHVAGFIAGALAGQSGITWEGEAYCVNADDHAARVRAEQG